MKSKPYEIKKGIIVTVSWAGSISYPVEIIGETPKRYRVRFLSEAHLPSNRWMKRGYIALLPKTAVTILG